MSRINVSMDDDTISVEADFLDASDVIELKRRLDLAANHLFGSRYRALCPGQSNVGGSEAGGDVAAGGLSGTLPAHT